MKEMFDNSDNESIFVKNETEMPKKLPEVNEEKLKNNPFSQDLVIKATKRIDPVAKIVDEDGVEVPAWSLVDKAKATKIYTSAAFRDRTLALSAGAMKMFLYIVYELVSGKDWILMTPEQYLSKGGGSKSSYLRAIDELVTEGYISTTLQKCVFWINPILFFKGNRIGKYPERVSIENQHVW